MTEIAVVATFVAKPGNEDKLKEALQGIVALTFKEFWGVPRYDLHRDIKEPRRFVVFRAAIGCAEAGTEVQHNQTLHT